MSEIAKQPPERLMVPKGGTILTARDLEQKAPTETGETLTLRGGGRATLVRLSDLEGQILYPELGIVLPQPDQPRNVFKPKEMQKMRTSLESFGQKNEVKLVPVRIEGTNEIRLMLIDGECRLITMTELGATHIRGIVRWEGTLQGIFEESFLLNFGENQHTPMEEARAYGRMLNARTTQGMSKEQAVKDICDRTGARKARVLNYLLLLNCPGIIQQAIEEGMEPRHALRIRSAVRKYGDKLDLARLARRIIDDPDGEHPLAQRGLHAGTISIAGVEHAIAESAALTTEEQVILSIRQGLQRLLAQLGIMQKTTEQLLDPQIPQDAMHRILRTRRGTPPEVLLEKAEAVLVDLRELYERILKPAAKPDPLPKPKNAPTFKSIIKNVTFKNPLRGKIAKLLAETADTDPTQLLTAANITKRLNEQSPEKPTDNAAVAGHMRILENELTQYGLKLDVQTRRRRSEIKHTATGKREFVTIFGYRIGWDMDSLEAKRLQ